MSVDGLDHSSKDIIMIYNRELKYVRCIVHEGIGGFFNLSSNSHGNLNDGVFLHSLGRDNKVNKLNEPRGMCVCQ